MSDAAEKRVKKPTISPSPPENSPLAYPVAIGGDHFRDAYLSMPMDREGAFRWPGNAMYAFAFLGLRA